MIFVCGKPHFKTLFKYLNLINFNNPLQEQMIIK